MYKIFTQNKLAWSILFFGILCRVAQYCSNRSFWADEAGRALDIKKYSFMELLQIKGFLVTKIYTAPYGFHAMQKLTFTFMGDSEYALRLFPLICGLISLFLYKKIVDWFIPEKSGLIALGLFAISHHLIFYSSEVIPYSSDVLFTLVIFILLKHIKCNQLNFTKVISIGLLGGTSLWFSSPVIFILAGGGFILMIEKIGKRDRVQLFHLIGIGFIWLISFLMYYMISLRHFTNDPSLLDYI